MMTVVALALAGLVGTWLLIRKGARARPSDEGQISNSPGVPRRSGDLRRFSSRGGAL